MYNVDEQVKEILGRDVTLCRDYPSIIKWAVDKIPQWTDSWTDFTITDPGILFVNAEAFLYDIVNYVLDESFLNDILRYTQSMQSLYFMSKFAGLTLPGYYCSTAKVSIYNDTGDEIVVPKDYGIYVRDDATNEMIYFYSLNSVKIRNLAYASTTFIEGKRGEVNTTFGEFYDNANFEFILPDPTIGLNSIFVYAEYDFPDGEYYTKDPSLRRLLQVDDALLNLADEPCFSAYYAVNKVVIQLCPGAADFFNADSKIKIIYGSAAGLKANVGTVVAKPLESLYVGNIPVSRQMTFTILHASGASIPYTLEETRVFIGNTVWRPETLIINADFDNLMNLHFPEIVRFTAVQEKGSELMTVYFVPAELDADGEPMSAARIRQLQDEVYDRAADLMFGGVKLKVLNSTVVEFDFVIEVYLKINTSDTSSVHDAIITILKAYFDRTKQPRNFYFRRGHVITMVESGVDEIYSIDLIYPVMDRQAKDDEIFVLGDVQTKFIQKNDFDNV